VKHRNTRLAGQMDIQIASGPGEAVLVDFIGPLVKSSRGNQCDFVVLYAFSKFVEIYPSGKKLQPCVQ
jgi:hypothetical protein